MNTPRRLLLAASLAVLPSPPPSRRMPAHPSGPITGGGNFQAGQAEPVTSVLDLYEQLSGIHIIRDAALSNVPLVTINVTGLSKADMLKHIQEVLLLNGVGLVPVDEHNAKAVAVGTTKNIRSEGVRLYANAADLPQDDEVVSYYMPLDYINPQEAVNIFSQTAPVHQYGAYVPAQSAQAVVVTENASVVRQLIALKELIDVPPAHVASAWVQLNRADSDKVADLLNKMLGVGPTGAPISPPGPNGTVIVPPDLGNRMPLFNEKNLISGTATILSDPKLNRILLVSRPVNMPFLEEMISQLDQPDIFAVPQRRALRYVAAGDILPALEAALASGKDEEDQVKKDQQEAQSQQNRGQPGAGGQNQPVASSSASSGGNGSGAVQAITPQLTTPTENDVPTVLTIGKTRLMADNRSNSIIVFGSPDIVNRVFDMVDELDRKPLQVYLRTVIGQLTVSQGMQFGIDILQKFQKIGQGGLATSNLNSAQVGSTSTGSTAPSFFPEPNTLTSAGGFPLPTGLTLYGAIGSTLDAYVRALETTDRFKIISTPSVYTTNNTLAVIASGSQVPVPSSITSGFTGAGTTTNDLATTASVAYEDVLLQLDIVPLINAKHEVTLKIRQTNNTLGNNVLISGNEVPIINTQEINTEITVPDRSTVVIGGLINDQTTRDVGGIPWLSDIPVLGYLFSNVNKSKQRDELIIMIQPSVVETDADQIAVNETEKQRTILGREAVEAATGVPSADQGAILPVQSVPGATHATTTSTTTGASAYNSKTGRSTTTTTTTTTVHAAPVQQITPIGPTSAPGPVPSYSSPAPDVQNGGLPPIHPPGPPSTAPMP